MSPEEKARQIIDKQLEDAGWVIQDRKEFNPIASLGVAVREYPTSDNEEVDYALFIEGMPVGLIEAKADEHGVELVTAAHEQNKRYVNSGLKWADYSKTDMRFIYEATGILTHFTDLLDPKPRVRKIFSFHQPEQLQYWLKDYKFNGKKTLRGRLQEFPKLPKEGFRDCQIKAILNLEKSFGDNKPRSLVQMATGAGKTYTAITNTYRLLKFAKAKRILFLVDTKNLGMQAEMEYKNYQPYDSTEKLNSLYNIQRIQTSNIPSSTQICISTIQRVYSMLTGSLSTMLDDVDDEPGTTTGIEREVKYNVEYPPEFFDFIIIDECHRSIYNQWRQVLEYFDAFLIGLTATPNQHTYAFFDENVVSEYTHEEAVSDGVNVGALGTFCIETEKTTQGGVVAKINQQIEIRDKRTRKQRWESRDEEISYDGKDLDNSVVNKSQIRVILQTFKENWKKWEYYKERKELPKTLIFAKNDSHADDIVALVKEVFNEGNDFCKKITFKSEENETTLLYAFRNEFNPRVAVTVNKIATGTDVKAIEILLFMRDIRSENYYEQMLGRARRTMDIEGLKQASPSATTPKLGYVIVDAVGVTKSDKCAAKKKCGGDVKPTVSFKSLLNSVVTGDTSEETFSTLGTRLEHIDKVLTDKEREDFKKVSGGISLRQLSTNIKNVHDVDKIEETIKTECPNYKTLPPKEQEEVDKVIIRKRCLEAAKAIYEPKVRDFLMNVRNSNDQTIDPALDHLIYAGFETDVSETKAKVRDTLKEFIEANKDELTALNIIYHQDYRNRHITEAMIHELYDRMKRYNSILNESMVFSAYSDMTRKSTVLKELVDIIQIIKYEWGQIPEIYPFADMVRTRYKEWIFERNANKGGVRGAGNAPFTEEQMKWLKMIRDYIAINASFQVDALKSGEFNKLGGTAKYYSLFGSQWKDIINELNQKLVA